MRYAYRALGDSGAPVTDVLESPSQSEAVEELRRRGMTPLSVKEVAGDDAASSARRVPLRRLSLRGAGARDVALFSGQMKMLLDAGAPLVTALDAVEQQAAGKAFARVVHAIREEVERGGSLTDGFRLRPDLFKPIYCSLVSAGEATAALPHAFSRLTELTQQQQRTRRAVMSALTYPLLLALLCIGTCIGLIGFVVPRFKLLFTSLQASVPASTQLLLDLSGWIQVWWPLVLGGLGACLAALLVFFRAPSLRATRDAVLFRLPLVGRLMARLILARILRIWAALLRSHAPLLEAIHASRDATTNASFQALVDDVAETVSTGGRIGRALGNSPLVDPLIVAAIATGEEHGRLTDAIEFVANWLDEDNEHMIATAMKLLEPAFLLLSGLIVGGVATSLFLPLFDAATSMH